MANWTFKFFNKSRIVLGNFGIEFSISRQGLRHWGRVPVLKGALKTRRRSALDYL